MSYSNVFSLPIAPFQCTPLSATHAQLSPQMLHVAFSILLRSLSRNEYIVTRSDELSHISTIHTHTPHTSLPTVVPFACVRSNMTVFTLHHPHQPASPAIKDAGDNKAPSESPSPQKPPPPPPSKTRCCCFAVVPPVCYEDPRNFVRHCEVCIRRYYPGQTSVVVLRHYLLLPLLCYHVAVAGFSFIADSCQMLIDSNPNTVTMCWAYVAGCAVLMLCSMFGLFGRTWMFAAECERLRKWPKRPTGLWVNLKLYTVEVQMFSILVAVLWLYRQAWVNLCVPLWTGKWSELEPLDAIEVSKKC